MESKIVMILVRAQGTKRVSHGHGYFAWNGVGGSAPRIFYLKQSA
ncbi:MAG: hypothetical protein OFPII_43370 [Osedax symbiont Rs1]|nr:MAG: hypothetical protein OFPII_43370 [Osedax symbiont Rs1]